MFRATLLLVLCGLALGSSPVQKEEYAYKGRMMVGVNNPRQAYAGSLIELKLTVDRHADLSADVKFEQAKAGDFNAHHFIGDAEFQRVSNMKQVAALQGTAKVYFGRDSGTVMEVKHDEPFWVTNVRKAIVSMLRVPPYIGTQSFVDLERNAFHTHGHQSVNNEHVSYFRTEQTFAGQCNVSYTMNPDFNDGHWEGSPDTVLPAGGQYFRMHRAIDYDSCHSAVSLQKTSYGNFSRVFASQFQQVQDRSAVGEYLLRQRSDGFYDIKGISQTAAQFIKPFGQDTGRVVAHTNQTLSLTKVSPGASSSGAGQEQHQKAVKTWYYQFISPAKPKQDTKVDWVVYGDQDDAPIYPEYAILGPSAVPSQDSLKKLTNQLLEQIAQLQLQENDDYRHPYSGTNDGRLAELLNVAARAIRALDYKSVKSIYDATKPKPSDSQKQMILRQSFLDASVASGSAPAIRCFAQAVKANEVDQLRAAGLLTAMVNNLIDPQCMPEVLSLVMSTSPKQHVILATAAHLNFAKLVQRVCVNANIKSYAVPEAYLGQKACDKNAVGKKFSDHIKQRIQSATTVWEVMMYTQSLASLGLDENIPVIRDIAMGKFAQSSVAQRTPVRIGAIQSLARNYPEKPQKQQVMLHLLPIAEAHAEDYRVREAAFITLVSMKPNSTFYERFAADSWRDPSYQMRSLVAATFISLAESDDQDFSRMSSVARQLLPTMRPIQPSMQSSLFFNFKTQLPEYKVGVESSIAWLQKYRSRMSAPQQLMQAVKGDFGGIEVPILEVYTMYDSSSILGVSAARTNSRDSQQKRIHEEMSQLAESLDQEMQQSDSNIYLYVSAFNYQAFFTFDKDTKPLLTAKVSSLLQKYAGQKEQPFQPQHMVKYYNPVDIISILPTPFGVPAIVEISAPNNLLSNYAFKVLKEHNAINVTLTGQAKATMKTQSYMSLLQPWSKTTAIAGFDTEVSVSIPGQVSMVLNTTYPFGVVRTTISPNFQGEKPLLHWRSKPLTAIKEMGPVSDITKSSNLLTCLADVAPAYTRSVEISQKYTGLKARIAYEGDVDYPLQQANLMKIIQNPALLTTLLTTPTSRDFSLSLKVDIQQSETKSISMASVVDYGYLNGDFRSSLKRGTPEQVGQQIAEEISLAQSPEELATRASQRQLGDFLISCAVNYTAPSRATPRQYALVITGTNQTKASSSQLEEALVVNIMRKGIPGSEQETKTCLVTAIKEQKAPSHGFNQSKRSQLYTRAHTDIYIGRQCGPADKIVSLQSDFFLRTDERARQPCQGQLACSAGLSSQTSRIPYISDAIYDKLNLELTIEKALPQIFQNASWWASDMAQGLLFPSLVKNRMPDARSTVPKNKVIVNVTRSIASGTADAWVHAPDSIAVIRSLEVPSSVDWATPLLGQRVHYHHQQEHLTPPRSSLESAPNGQCIVKPQEVETFDGVDYQRTPSVCWEVASMLYHEEDSFSILTRQSDSSAHSEMEAMIVVPSVASIEITKGNIVKLNSHIVRESESIKDHSGQVVGSVVVSSAEVTVHIENKMHVVLKNHNELQIELPEHYKNAMTGMCGDYNGEKAADLKSPKGCIMTPAQGQVYAASWVAHKNQCHEDSMAQYIRQAETLEAGQCTKSLSSNHQQSREEASSRGC